MTLKERFEQRVMEVVYPRVLVVAVEIDGNVETITNHDNAIPAKIEYYRNRYDADFRLKGVPAATTIQIVDFMLV